MHYGRWLLSGLGLGVCGLCGPGVAAVQGAEPAVIIHAGTLLSVPGRPPQNRQTVIIRDGRVAEIRAGFLSAQDVGAGASVRIIDLSKQFVMPGMIDLHVHLTTEAEQGESLRVVTRNAADLALVARKHARETLEAGFTTVLDLGTARLAHNEAIYALRGAIDRGVAVGPRVLVAGSPISATGSSRTGHFAAEVEAVVGPDGTCNGPDDCQRAVREQIARGADVINFYNTGSIGDLHLVEQAMTDAEMLSIVVTAHSLGRKVIADGHTAAGIKAAVRAGADIIDTGPWADAESFDLMRRRKVFFEPHLYAFVIAVGEERSGSTTVEDEPTSPILQRLRSVLAKPFSAQLANDKGVRLAYGSDTGIVPHGDNAGDFAQLVKIGLSPAQAIEVATINSAAAIGLSDEAGSLEAGKGADVIAMERSPLEDIRELRKVTFVMRDGNVFKTH
ncbi:MAG TPA: amidohydrolase family protein [Steroidobacteraceae bacterium]|nr:amidohydrolase family protein [Steroidobacteraceae bacterium]